MADVNRTDLFATGRRGPLEGRRGGSAIVTLTPAETATRLSLRAKGDAVAALSTALGIDLPRTPKASASANGRHALWLGPDEWLLIDESGADLAEAAGKAGVLSSVVDVSHRNTAIHVAGDGAEATLAAGCPQDLSLNVFPVGACARTVLGKIEVVLWRRAPTEFRVELWRSFSAYAFDFLSEAARDAAA